MLRPIVVGLDGSRESRAAADWAAREAQRRAVPLRLVTAWIWRPVDVPSAQESEAQRLWAQGLLSEVREDLAVRHPELPIEVVQVSDLAPRALLGQTEHAEMLVLGSRGHGAIAGFLLGSVGQQVLARASVPVVLVRSSNGDAAQGTRSVDQDGGEVVVGIQDRDEPVEELLEFAFAAAAARGATLRAVHAWSRPPVFAHNPAAVRMGDEDGGWEGRVEKELLDALAPWRKRYPQVEVAHRIDLAPAAEVVLQAAPNASLVVVGRKTHRPALGMRIGPVTHGVIHHAHAPVAVVPHG
ncbi:universal stress protein [Streptomyces sp. RK62]|uniref:universal stress protein n=1 Tax=Streptomyces sp. RK62 TaxID=2824893 RepID=UPI001B389205|nr:universal stress protein [Streptomyces sp. RK62]MBQ0997397.1 universal stress protein [Streptomyces sp. RK62]